MILMIDNYDSFTYNIVQYLGELEQEVTVWRNDDCSIDDIAILAPEMIFISPGPCNPDKAGISIELVKHFAGKIPIFGVCLGFQVICQVYGGSIVKAKQIMHGKTSPVYHTNKGVFEGISNPFTATRYHSLVMEQATTPNCLEVTAWTHMDNDSTQELEEIMGIRHRELPIEGVQFHPESIMTDAGHQLFQNFIQRHQ